MALLSTETPDLASEYPVLDVRKLANPATDIEVTPGAKQRSRTTTPAERNRAETDLLNTAMHFFAGEMTQELAIELFWPWKTAKDLLDS